MDNVPSWRPRNAVLVILALLGLAAIGTFAWISKSLLIVWLHAIQASGVAGPVLLALLYWPVSFPFFYGYSVLTIAAGFLFGFWTGVIVVISGATTGACLAWVVSKFFLGDFFQARLSGYRLYRAILLAVEKDAFKIVFLCRLVPIPFGIMNSILSLSKVSLTEYISSTALGLLPEAMLFCYFGTTVRDVQELTEGNTPLDAKHIAMMIAGAVGAGLLFFFLARAGREALKDVDREDTTPAVEAKV